MAQEHILSVDNILPFFFAGRATFTLRSQKTGNRFTYRIKKARKGDVYYFLVLINHSYEYVGNVSKHHGLWVSPRSRVSPDDINVKAFVYTFDHIRTGRHDNRVEVWHEGRCGKCNRILTVPESIERGIGPECSGEKSMIRARNREKQIERLRQQALALQG